MAREGGAKGPLVHIWIVDLLLDSSDSKKAAKYDNMNHGSRVGDSWWFDRESSASTIRSGPQGPSNLSSRRKIAVQRCVGCLELSLTA